MERKTPLRSKSRLRTNFHTLDSVPLLLEMCSSLRLLHGQARLQVTAMLLTPTWFKMMFVSRVD
jgi:hypothetical protein